MGTSVGAGALTLTQALVLGSIAEFLGAVTLGSFVSKTISKGLHSCSVLYVYCLGYFILYFQCLVSQCCLTILSVSQGVIEPESYEDTPDLFSLAMFAVLWGAGATTLLATMFGLPISATHGATPNRQM